MNEHKGTVAAICRNGKLDGQKWSRKSRVPVLGLVYHCRPRLMRQRANLCMTAQGAGKCIMHINFDDHHRQTSHSQGLLQGVKFKLDSCKI